MHLERPWVELALGHLPAEDSPIHAGQTAEQLLEFAKSRELPTRRWVQDC
jgi:hypothetical protein